jgi:hypothetical protein
MASTNFLPINPNANNQDSDSAYSADGFRQNGGATNAIVPSTFINKAWYQSGNFIYAFALMMVAKGYSPNDGSADPATAIANLVGVLTNVICAIDLEPYALLNSPVFTGTPQAPTPALGTANTQLATTAFIQNLINNLLPIVGLSANLKVEFGSGTSNSDPYTVIFPQAFSGKPVVVAVADATTVGVSLAGTTPTQFTMQIAGGANFQWIAIGPK